MCFKVCAFVIVYLLISSICAFRQQQGCSIDVNNKDLDKFSPVLLYNHSLHFDFVIPDKGVIKLRHGERITFACTDSRNYLTATNSNSTYATCVGEETFKVVTRNLPFDDLKCKKPIRGTVQTTRKKCVNNRGSLINIGYGITRTDWITLIKVCYDEDNGATLYTQHAIRGVAIKYAAKSTQRPSFSTKGLGQGVAASIAYKQTFQKSTFNKLLGSAQTAERYINAKSYLIRGHLSPAADFLYTTTQSTTFYYLNTCPQWRIINGGNWNSLETKIRKTVERYNDTFTIITGTYGVLSLTDVNNNEKEIYLVSGSKLPVPKHIWKIVYDEDTKMGIALIVLNDPFVRSIRDRDLLCENICDSFSWSWDSWSDASRGYVYCCDLNDFVNVVDSAPVLEVIGVLRGISTL